MSERFDDRPSTDDLPVAIDAKLHSIASEIDRTRERIRKAQDQLRDLERDRDALIRSAEILTGFRPGLSESARTPLRVIDAILEVVKPGEQIALSEIVARLAGRTDVKINPRTPGSTVSVALSRSGDFRQVRKGLYERILPPGFNGSGTKPEEDRETPF